MSVETIFDHNVTPDEVAAVLGTRMSRDEYLNLVTEADSEYALIYRLFLHRNDKATAEKYFGKIKSPELIASIVEVNEGTT